MDTELIADETKPLPATRSHSLSAMEGAGKLVDDEDLAEHLKKRTRYPATRASTIEHLIKENIFVVKVQKLFLPQGRGSFQFLHAAGVEVLTSPAMTGEWEQKLGKLRVKCG